MFKKILAAVVVIGLSFALVHLVLGNNRSPMTMLKMIAELNPVNFFNVFKETSTFIKSYVNNINQVQFIQFSGTFSPNFLQVVDTLNAFFTWFANLAPTFFKIVMYPPVLIANILNALYDVIVWSIQVVSILLGY